MTNIDPKDLRPGDRIRITDQWIETVHHIEPNGWIGISKKNSSMGPSDPGSDHFTRTWELIERPKPEAKLGSVWVDTATIRRWVAIGSGQYALEAPSDGRASAIIGPWNDDGRAIIARLVPAEEQA